MHADTLSVQLIGGRVPADRADDWNAVKYVLTRLKDAWDHGDAAAYARCFSADAVYVIFVGTTYVGRSEIERSHQALFTKFAKGTTTFLTVLDVRFHGPDTATVLTVGDASKRPPRPGRGKVQSFTFHRGADGWECVTFHNTKRRPLMERVSFRMDRRFRPDHAI